MQTMLETRVVVQGGLCVCLCQPHTACRDKTIEPTEMPFGGTHVHMGARNHALDGGAYV